MMKKSVIVLVTWLCLAAFAGSAFAECAWVLWAQGWPPRGTTEPLEAFVTKAECVTRMTEVGQTIARTLEWQRVDTNLRCLPDTIDPRGPNGER